MSTAVCTPDELRTLFLFEKLNDEQLAWLCRDGRVEVMSPGPVYTEGEPATCFYVLIEGTIVLSRRVGADDVEISRTSQRGVYAGAWQSYLGDRSPQTYPHTLRVTGSSRFFVLDASVFAEMVQAWFPMALHLLEGLFFGSRDLYETIGQRERLLALGSLSAGLTHELNNPAAAAVRATAALRDRVAGMRHKLGTLTAGRYDRLTLDKLVAIQEAAVDRVASAPALNPIEAGDREDAIGDWLSDHGIAGGWDLAPTFVQAGLDESWLDELVTSLPPDALEAAVRWLNYSVETELLMTEIEDSVDRISSLVGAAKQYSQMGKTPYRRVDVHELLDSTVVMLARKLGDGVTVAKEYDRTLPEIPAYAAELNQVFTNVIDNAVAAMEGKGTLTIRTAADDDRLLVEIADTGPGIDPKIVGRIFEPFFTTKPVGEGTGLGLDISWRIVVNKHHGDLRVESVPGDTRFQIRLPFQPASDL